MSVGYCETQGNVLFYFLNVCTKTVKDPVLPMILSGLTMNFILYEKDYGQAIARLCIVVSTFK